ncbi:MAG TPA: outer membrane protein assembly factor BamA [Gemmatimonadaceae bacterium]|nr:outer membrane protein assembly factor BamA [Gemmatimonadaceae bacterium]
MPCLKRAAVAVALTLGLATSAAAQDWRERCSTPDTIVVRGNVRTTRATIVALFGLTPGKKIESYAEVQRGVKALFESGDYEDDVHTECENLPNGKVGAVVYVRERPLLGDISVKGAQTQTQRAVEDRVELLIGRPVDPMLVARGIARIDSLYETSGFYLARVTPETTYVDSTHIKLVFRIEEGRRLAISGLTVRGNKRVSASDMAGVMKTRPEGWLWFRKGEYDDEKFAGDLGERLPSLFARKGYLDFQVLRDTMIVDRTVGKGMLEIDVKEGPEYQIGTFSSRGNRFLRDDQVRALYPFADDGLSAAQKALNVLRGKKVDPTVFDNARWEAFITALYQTYRNSGYIYADINPILERSVRSDSTPVVNMRLEIDEQSPAIINRINIVGNEYTTESCIRDVLQVIPGDVFSFDRLMRSYQALANMGFFESPIPEPEQTRANDAGDIDITFHVKEKRTGTINFGASMGQGTGLGGFIGLEQPNLFGKCKRGSLNWQFGKYINDFNLAYTDPAIKLSRISGTVNVYRSQARYQIADLGQTTRIGGSVRAGFPIPHTNYSRAFISYTGESVKYGTTGLLGTVQDCKNCFRSAVGLDFTRDTRAGLPFPFQGSLQSFSASFNGGPLGGSANFQRYTGEYRAFAMLKQIGGKKQGAQPIFLTAGLSSRAGAVFGNTGPFFFSQKFALGGVQFGEPLRGYPEFSITPKGFLTGTSTYNAQRESFGNAFFATTMEVGLRFNSSFYLNVFYDAGNVWNAPREFDPTKLFRGAGLGLSTVTPLGPLGLDWAYGFDRLDAAGRRAPQWQLHFRLGQLF